MRMPICQERIPFVFNKQNSNLRPVKYLKNIQIFNIKKKIYLNNHFYHKFNINYSTWVRVWAYPSGPNSYDNLIYRDVSNTSSLNP